MSFHKIHLSNGQICKVLRMYKNPMHWRFLCLSFIKNINLTLTRATKKSRFSELNQRSGSKTRLARERLIATQYLPERTFALVADKQGICWKVNPT